MLRDKFGLPTLTKEVLHKPIKTLSNGVEGRRRAAKFTIDSLTNSHEIIFDVKTMEVSSGIRLKLYKDKFL